MKLQPSKSKTRFHENAFSIQIRGGGGGETSIKSYPAQEIVTFGSSFSLHLFAFAMVAIGILYGADPNKALACYGISEKVIMIGQEDEQKESSNDLLQMHFLSKMVASHLIAIGITSAFAITCETLAHGRLPTKHTFHKAIGIGIMPTAFPFLIEIFQNMRLHKRENKSVFHHSFQPLAALSLVIFSTISLLKPYRPVIAVNLLVLRNMLIGALLLARPKVLFQSPPAEMRTFYLSRLLSVLLVTHGILLAGLQSPLTNAMPSVGYAGMIMAVGLAMITNRIKKEVSIKGTPKSLPQEFYYAHFISIAIGFGVAAGGLRHFLLV